MQMILGELQASFLVDGKSEDLVLLRDGMLMIGGQLAMLEATLVTMRKIAQDCNGKCKECECDECPQQGKEMDDTPHFKVIKDLDQKLAAMAKTRQICDKMEKDFDEALRFFRPEEMAEFDKKKEKAING